MSAHSWQPPALAVRAANEASIADAEKLAARLTIPMRTSGLDTLARQPEAASGDSARATRRDSTWELIVDDVGRQLRRPDGVSMTIDFTRGRSAARQQESGLGRQPLARALGIARLRKRLGNCPTIVDSTGGLGRDAWFAASLGCPVIMIERSPIIHALLESALMVAAGDTATDDIASRIDLRLGDATTLLAGLPEHRRDVIYLDPMYPPTRRRAAVTKGMQFLHALLGPDIGNDGLLEGALAAARSHVTVKRPPGAVPLAGGDTFKGQRTEIVSPGTRYDIYHL